MTALTKNWERILSKIRKYEGFIKLDSNLVLVVFVFNLSIYAHWVHEDKFKRRPFYSHIHIILWFF